MAVDRNNECYSDVKWVGCVAGEEDGKWLMEQKLGWVYNKASWEECGCYVCSVCD